MQNTQKNLLPTTQEDNATFVELSETEQSVIVGGLNFAKIERKVSGDPSQWLTRKVNEYEGQH